MKITTVRNKEGKVVVKVGCDLASGRDAAEFKDTLQKLYDEGEKEIVLDLNGVGMINSYGIGKILMFYKRFKDVGGKLYIKGPLQGTIKETFQTIMLDKLLKEYREEEAD